MKQKLLTAMLATGFFLSAQAAEPAAPVEAKTPEAKPAEANKPFVTVNGVALPAVYANFLRQARAARGTNPEALTDEVIRDAMVNIELMAQEALRQGLDKTPTVAAALEFQRRELLSQAALEEFARTHPIAEETLKGEYDAAKAKTGDAEYRARHILVDSEKEAKDVIAKLKNKKTKFEQLAGKLSKDSSAGNGGDLGWVQPGNLVPEFSQAMTKMKPGETSKEPVKTQFGWHVIKLEETRKLDFPAYDKVKNRIAAQLQQQAMRKYVQELRATAKVE